MKPHLAFVALWLISYSGWGQGTVLFANRVPGLVDARVSNGSLFDPFRGPADGRFLAQLYAAAPGLELSPVGDPVPFLDSPGEDVGYITPVERVIPGAAVGSEVQVMMVAWYRSLGSSYGEAISRSMGGVGQSAVILVTATGGGASPPAPLEGLQGFGLGSILGGIDPRPQPIVPAGFPLTSGPFGQSTDFYPYFEWAQGLAVRDSMVYVASGYGGIRIFDARDPVHPVRLGYRQFDFTLARGVAVAGRHAYLAVSDWGGGGANPGLHVVDVADPTQPQPVSHLRLEGEPQTVSLTADGRYALVSAGAAGLYVVDVQEPTMLKVAGRYPSGAPTQAVVALGNLGLLAAGTNGLHVLDLTQPTQPIRLGLYVTHEALVDVVARGSIAYVSGRQHGLHLVDISDPSQPRQVGFASLAGGAGPSTLGGRHVYVQSDASAASPQGGLSVVDISNAASPRVVGWTTVAKGGRDLAVMDGQLWIADTTVLTGLPLGPRLDATRGLAFEVTGLLGQPYEIQETTSLVAPWLWSRVMEAEGTGSPQALNLPTSASAARLIRAVALP